MRPIPSRNPSPTPMKGADDGQHSVALGAQQPPPPEQSHPLEAGHARRASSQRDRSGAVPGRPLAASRRPPWAQQGDSGGTEQESTSPRAGERRSAAQADLSASDRPISISRRLAPDQTNQPLPTDSEEQDLQFAGSADTVGPTDLSDVYSEGQWWVDHPDAAQILDEFLTETNSGQPGARDKHVSFDLTGNSTFEVSRHIVPDRGIETPQTQAALIQRALADLDEAKEEISAAADCIEDLVTKNTLRGGSIKNHSAYTEIQSAMTMAHTATKNCEDTRSYLRSAQETTNYSDITMLTARVTGSSANIALDSAAAAQLLIAAYGHGQNSEIHLIHLRSMNSVYRALHKEIGLAQSYKEQLDSVLSSQTEQQELAAELAVQSAYAAYRHSSTASDLLTPLLKNASSFVRRHREFKFSHREIKEAHKEIECSHAKIRSFKEIIRSIPQTNSGDTKSLKRDPRYSTAINAIKASHSAAKHYKSILKKVDSSLINVSLAPKIAKMSKAAIDIAEINAIAGLVLMAKMSGNRNIYSSQENLTEENFLEQLGENIHYSSEFMHEISSHYAAIPEEKKQLESDTLDAARAIFNSTSKMYASASSTVRAAFNTTGR